MSSYSLSARNRHRGNKIVFSLAASAAPASIPAGCGWGSEPPAMSSDRGRYRVSAGQSFGFYSRVWWLRVGMSLHGARFRLRGPSPKIRSERETRNSTQKLLTLHCCLNQGTSTAICTRRKLDENLTKKDQKVPSCLILRLLYNEVRGGKSTKNGCYLNLGTSFSLSIQSA